MDLARSLIARGPFTPLPHREANRVWRAFRVLDGAAANSPKLLTDPEHNAKFEKTQLNTQRIIYGLQLAHADTSGPVNNCRYHTLECKAGCVSTAGRGVYDTTQRGKVRRTLFLHKHPEAFLGLLTYECEQVWKKWGREARIRLNTFSDLPWEVIHPELFSRFPRQCFYDYTKWPADKRPNVPKNYRLTFSASEKTTDSQIIDTLIAGRNVAIVFFVKRNDDLPKRWLSYPVIDGDKNDDRYSDPRGRIVGLRAKGKMRNNGSTMPRKVA